MIVCTNLTVRHGMPSQEAQGQRAADIAAVVGLSATEVQGIFGSDRRADNFADESLQHIAQLLQGVHDGVVPELTGEHLAFR